MYSVLNLQPDKAGNKGETMSKKTYIREIKTVSTDRYMEVDLFRITERQHKAKRAGKSRPSSPVQDNLNQRRAARKRLQLMNANFCEGESFHLSLTYSPEMLPQNDGQAKADRVNYLRRVARECRRRGMPPPKVMGVTAGAPGKPRYHHHMVIACGLPRELLEDMWRKGSALPDERPEERRRRAKLWTPGVPCAGEKIGRANADRAQPEHESLAQLCRYFESQPCRKWFQSRNLQEPVIRRPSDRKFTPNKLDRACKDGRVYDREFWRKHYPGYELAEDPDVRYDEINGWMVTLRLYRPWADKRRD